MSGGRGLRGTGTGLRVLWLAIALALLGSLVVVPVAGAVSDEEELTRFGSLGSAAGQVDLPSGIAAETSTGHVYVVEENSKNSRISEFTPWGDFVKAFGWDVAPGAVNEQQEVRMRAAAGEFKLSFGASTTTDLAFNASGSAVEAALNALPSIGGAGGSVGVEAVTGTADGKTPTVYVIAFKGSLAGSNVAQLAATNGTTSLSGGDPSTSLEVRTRAEGSAGGVGLESCTAESLCKGGLKGGGAGQLDEFARGAAVDAAGNLYVREVTNRRVQKFDSAGHFLLMFGGEVNKTTSANRCTKAELEGGEVCGAGVPGAADGQFAGFGGGIALCAGTLYVADKDRIQRFDLEGEFIDDLPVAGETVQGLACDPAGGAIYASFAGKNDVPRLSTSTGEEVGKVPVSGLGAIATDPAGNLFAASGNEVLQFDPAGKPLVPPSCCKSTTVGPAGLGTNHLGTLYVAYSQSSVDSFLRAFGPAPVSFESPPALAPEITAQFATAVQREDALVAAEINPRLWTDTRYFMQYGTEECSKGGCVEIPVPPGPLLTTKAVNEPVKTAEIPLEGLEPGTTYHFRFVAESSGGGPAYGIDPDGEGPKEASAEEGREATFTTFPVPPALRPCPNDLLRLGPARRLPDCRAYEMVSPVDKNNGDIKSLLDVPGFITSLGKSAEDGARFTYTSFRSFGAPQGGAYANQYLASRDPVSGWSSEGLDPALTAQLSPNSFENHSKAFTADLCRSWLMVAAEPVLDPDAPPGYLELYRRDNCGGGGHEALIGVEPTTEAIYPILQGTSASGKEAIFMAEDKLTPEAASGVWQTYYASEGDLHLLCVLPDGTPSGGNCSGGTSGIVGLPQQLERLSSLAGALSADGTKAYWTDSGAQESGAGKVYLRLDPGEAQAETVAVSETVTPEPQKEPARFLGASTDGAKALFEVTAGTLINDLYKFELGGGSTKIADKVLGVAGASEDLSRVYFVSEEALAGGAIAGKPNLYLDEEGAKSFIATISKVDAVGVDSTLIGKVPSNANFEPTFHAARATPDGRVLAFISTESPTGYDSTDLLSGRKASEVYIYEAGSEEPVCISCNPSGARPTARVVTSPRSTTGLATAGWLPLPESTLYFPRVLSPDGQRLLFNSFDALLPRDTNGKGDVYQWQSAPDQATCEQRGAELYAATAGGCISLISGGESPQDAELLDISVNGDDAFFTTNASLLPRDPGLIDVYDARVGGGIAEPPPPAAPCQGDSCQPVVQAPNDPTPSSSSYVGPEDEVQKKKSNKKKSKNKKAKKNKKKKQNRRQGTGR